MRKKIETASEKLTHWIGSVQSIIFHSFFFVAIFGLRIFGLSSSEILLVLTTLVSLEAIYLAIFIQMTVNKQAKELEEVGEDIEEIQKDVDEIQEDIEEDYEGEILERVENTLGKLIEEMVELKKQQKQSQIKDNES